MNNHYDDVYKRIRNHEDSYYWFCRREGVLAVIEMIRDYHAIARIIPYGVLSFALQKYSFSKIGSVMNKMRRTK